MRIAGLQPLSLLDFPGRVAAIVFTQGCPFRCGYCHNPELLPTKGSADLGINETLGRIGSRRRLLDGVVVTGGEPTVHPDLPEFLARIKAMGLETKLDTNGIHPRMVERIIRDGLADYFAMDLKHVWRRYAEIIGSGAKATADNCARTWELIRDSGIPHEFRTTVDPLIHSEDDLAEIASYVGPGGHYALQRLRYVRTLRADLPRAEPLDLQSIATRLRAARSDLCIEVRA